MTTGSDPALRRFAREVFDCARTHGDDDSPLWSSYVAAFSDEDAFAAYWPAVVELALSGRRDWYTLEKMKAFPADLLTLIAVGLPDTRADRQTVEAFAALMNWHRENTPLPSDDGGDEIPF